MQSQHLCYTEVGTKTSVVTSTLTCASPWCTIASTTTANSATANFMVDLLKISCSERQRAVVVSRDDVAAVTVASIYTRSSYQARRGTEMLSLEFTIVRKSDVSTVTYISSGPSRHSKLPRKYGVLSRH